MTQAQKTAKAKFKQAIAYRQKTGVSLKEAFLHIYGKKKVVKKAVKKSASKKIAKKLGALPIGFKGSIYDIPFKIVNQYDIYNDVSAIMEDTNTGNRIVTFDGKGTPKLKAETILSYISKATNIQGGYRDDKQLYSRMLKFATNMQKEVKDYNSGIKKTIKKQPLKIAAPIKKKAVVKKKVAVKKAIVKKKAVKKTSNIVYDKKYQAKKPGKRVSNTGKVYYEYRENRSDKGRLLGVKNKKITEKGILNKIHIVKRNVDKLDEAQHKHMMGKAKQDNKILSDYKEILGKIRYYENNIIMYKDVIKNYKTRSIHPSQLQNLKLWVKTHTKLLKEYKTHAKELKKLI
jgi:hypothetical protein